MVMMIVRHDVSSRASVVERESLDTDSATVRHDVFSRASMVERESVDVDSATVRERDESRRRSFDDDVVGCLRTCFVRIVPSVSVYTECYDCTRRDL